jgi:hypothetical protein
VAAVLPVFRHTGQRGAPLAVGSGSTTEPQWGQRTAMPARGGCHGKSVAGQDRPQPEPAERSDSLMRCTECRGSMLADVLLSHGLHLGDFVIPWSIVILIAIVVVGLLLIRTAITLVKVAILVGIGIVIFLAVQFLFNNFA